MRADEMPMARLAKLLEHGRSGVGKTWSSARATRDPERTVIALTESQGALQIRQSNPHATIVPIREFEDWRDFVRAMTAPHPDCRGEGCDDCAGTGVKGRTKWDAVVMDSITDLQRFIKVHVATDKSRPAGNRKLREGVLAMDDWQVVGSYLERALRALRDMPYHVVCTAITDETISEDGSITARPALQGYAKTVVGQYFNAICHLQTRRGEGDEVIREGTFDSPGDAVLCKPSPALEAVEPVDVASWLERLSTYTSEDEDGGEL